MGLVLAIFSALSAALKVFGTERALYNSPDLVKAKLADQSQAAKDAANVADSVLADPNSTPEAHRAALDELRKAMS